VRRRSIAGLERRHTAEHGRTSAPTNASVSWRAGAGATEGRCGIPALIGRLEPGTRFCGRRGSVRDPGVVARDTATRWQRRQPLRELPRSITCPATSATGAVTKSPCLLLTRRSGEAYTCNSKALGGIGDRLIGCRADKAASRGRPGHPLVERSNRVAICMGQAVMVWASCNASYRHWLSPRWLHSDAAG
jgi:hypothetical protein